MQQKYCPFCGIELVLPPEYPHPIPQCPSCNYLGLNAPKPVVLTLVYDNNRLLLGRSPRFPLGTYALLAGHVELGENAEAAAQREVKEESGVECEITHYMGSFPLVSRGQLCLTFAAKYLSGEAQADDDVEDVQWFDIDADLPVNGSIAKQVIDSFRCKKGAKIGAARGCNYN